MADALVLAGGVAKGPFIAGALAHLIQDRDLDVRRIVATSSGALSAAFLAAAIRRGDAAEAVCDLCDLWIDHGTFADAFDVSVRGIAALEGLSTNARLLDLLRRYVRPTAGGQPIDLHLVVTAIEGTIDRRSGPPATTFERVLSFPGETFDGGARLDYLFQAVTASAAFPLAFLPVTLPIGGREVDCYDGGLVNGAPLKHALDDPAVTRVFVIAPYPCVVEARPADAHGLGLLAHLGDVLVNERLYRDTREARSVNHALARLEARVAGDQREAALDALGWRGRRRIEIVEIRPDAPLDGNAFDGFFSRDLRTSYVNAGADAARAWLATRAA
jgi:predicted acylesterase/phospholipase RssA